MLEAGAGLATGALPRQVHQKHGSDVYQLLDQSKKDGLKKLR